MLFWELKNFVIPSGNSLFQGQSGLRRGEGERQEAEGGGRATAGEDWREGEGPGKGAAFQYRQLLLAATPHLRPHLGRSPNRFFEFLEKIPVTDDIQYI